MELILHCEDIVLKYRIEEGDPEFIQALIMTSLEFAISQQTESRKGGWRNILPRSNAVHHERELIKCDEMENVKVHLVQYPTHTISAFVQLSCSSDINKHWFKKAQKTIESFIRVFETT